MVVASLCFLTCSTAPALVVCAFSGGFIKAEIVGWDDYKELQLTKGLDKVHIAPAFISCQQVVALNLVCCYGA